jgi:hypothetical protein
LDLDLRRRRDALPGAIRWRRPRSASSIARLSQKISAAGRPRS